MDGNDMPVLSRLANRAKRWPHMLLPADIQYMGAALLELLPKRTGKPPIVKAQVEIAGTPYEIRLTAQERK